MTLTHLQTPIISVIIPAYNAAATLPATLQSLERQTLPAAQYEVIVANDCSNDSTAEIGANYNPPYSFMMLQSDLNRGASAARNLAASQARGDLLVFIDADCVAHPDLLAAHQATHRTSSSSIGVAGRIIWSQEFKDGPLAEYYKDLYFPAQPDVKAGAQAVPFTHFVTSNASLPRPLFEKLGGFDQDFRYLWDDTVLGYRLTQAGCQLIFEPQAVVFHHRPLLPGEAIARFRRQGQEGMRLLAKYPELVGVAVDPGEILADRYHQEELYNLLARYALGLGYTEGAARYFDTSELDDLLARPEFASNFAVWRDRRLEMYRAELTSLKADKVRTAAYLSHLEAAYQRELKRNQEVQAELASERLYNARLERTKAIAAWSILKQRLSRWGRKGKQVAGKLATKYSHKK